MIYIVSYIVSYTNYEEYVPTILEGEEILNWKEFCDTLIPQAVKATIKEAETYDGYIGWNEIVEALVKILISEYDYKRINPKGADYFGSAIIKENRPGGFELESDILEQILQHNERVKKVIAELKH